MDGEGERILGEKQKSFGCFGMHPVKRALRVPAIIERYTLHYVMWW